MPAEILEEGRIYFFYRPRVGETEVDDLEDVQRLHMVLDPQGINRFRILVIGKKCMPNVEEAHERLWATVTDVVEGTEQLREALGPRTYETQTRRPERVCTSSPATTTTPTWPTSSSALSGPVMCSANSTCDHRRATS
jgi:hypothetical protein